MSASDSPTPAPDRPCGLSSIIPRMSCRGRAEAFARRLQSKLSSLGSQAPQPENENENTPQHDENTWLSQPEVPMTSLQPLRITQNEADSFFDFDIENESPGSPEEECEYTRLVETTSVTPHEAVVTTESGYVCASPENSSHSSQCSDAQFYDPDASDAERASISGADYYDCVDSSLRSKDSLSSISSNNLPLVNGVIATILDNSSDSFSDSLPPSQSTESNSTFIPRSSNSNSTLQDVTVDVYKDDRIDNYIDNNNIDIKDDDEEEEEDEEDVVTTKENIDESEKLVLNGHAILPYDNDYDIRIINIDNELSTFDIRQELTVGQVEAINGSVVIHSENDIECFFTEKEEIKIDLVAESCEVKQEDLQIEKNVQENDEDNKEDAKSVDDEDEMKPQRIRRCSSLKTGKTPPGTPGRKKIVRFADVLGLDLADVRTFLDEVPKIPKQAYDDLEITESTPQIQEIKIPKTEKVLAPLFQQPGSMSNFLDLVREKQVNLENCIVVDPTTMTIAGTVRVRNLDFHKSVYIRYSIDGWHSFADLQAQYIENSCDGFSDKFSFTLFGNSVQIGGRLELAIRFHCKGQQFWDSNHDSNYVFQCLPSSATIVAPLIQTSRDPYSVDDSWAAAFW